MIDTDRDVAQIIEFAGGEYRDLISDGYPKLLAANIARMRTIKAFNLPQNFQIEELL